jgi:transcriptional regulator with XRE-family HTH domain
VLGDELRKAREAAGFTQERLAFRAGVDRTFVSIVERGLQSPSVDTLIRICRVLGVRASDVIGRIEGHHRPKKRKPRRAQI